MERRQGGKSSKSPGYHHAASREKPDDIGKVFNYGSRISKPSGPYLCARVYSELGHHLDVCSV